jgi:flagellar motor protein MotB
MSLVKIKASFDPSNPAQLAAAMNFLSAVGGNVIPSGTSAPAETTTADAPKEEAPKKRASRAKKPAETTEEPKKETPSETPKTEEKAEKGITLEDIRSLTSKKAKDHREAIKAKITEWGANNVVQIPEDKFKEFMDFLNSL